MGSKVSIKRGATYLKNGVIITTDFKLNVMDYYQTHEDAMAEVAARLDILTAQFPWSLCLIVSGPLLDFSSWL